MMDPMRDLAVPPELDTLLKKVKDFKPVHTPRLNVQEEHSRPVPQNESADLPDNVDEFLFSRFVTENFIDRNEWGVLSTALRHPLTRNTTERDERVAVELNRMILRVMLDKNLSASQIKLFVDFLINKILWNYQIRDEALCQIASLTWNNNDKANKKRLWVLLSSCLSCIIPSSSFYNYLLKYVSDHASDGYEALLQQKLLSMPRNQSPEEKRLFPPSILEWKSNDSHAPMAVKIHLPNDTTALIEVNSWTTAEDAANRAMESIMGGSKQGWSLVLVSDNKRMTEISGHDYLFDLFSRMELFPELQTPPDEFLSYGTGANEKPNFNSAQSSYADRPSRTEPKEVPVDVPEARPSHDRSYSGGVNSNFSFGPPNIRIPSNLHGPGGLGNQHVDPETGGLASRIKGGGKMMNPMGMGTMMQQPQMMPMMQQQPMMPMQPMNMGMMQQPMMQQPMMQQPMMQQPMMQQPMMQQPMMQQPVYQPMMQQMPGSIGMMSAAMDSSGQQTTIQHQMQKLMKQQEEMRQTMEKESKRRDEEDRDRWRRSERRHRRDSSSEDRHRRRERRDSSGEDYRRERRRSSEKDKKRSSYKENRGWKPTEQGYTCFFIHYLLIE